MRNRTERYKDTAVFFLHGYGSSNQTDKFLCIENQNKFCKTVDYNAKPFADIQQDYEKDYLELKAQFKTLVIVAHSLGCYFADALSSQYQVPTLMLMPCLKPSFYVGDRIPTIQELELKFQFQNQAEQIIVIENDDEILNKADIDLYSLQERENYQLVFLSGGHHRICRSDMINNCIDDLLGLPLVFIEDWE